MDFTLVKSRFLGVLRFWGWSEKRERLGIGRAMREECRPTQIAMPPATPVFQYCVENSNASRGDCWCGHLRLDMCLPLAERKHP